VISILHFWPPQGSPLPAIACGADDGVRSSHIGSVTCSGCVAAVALDERRQRAREAGLDAYSDVLAVPLASERALHAIDDAVETATRVQVTHEIVMAFLQAPDNPDDITGPLRAAFRAAGFEVEQ
jgi:hypothetical protein